MQTFPDLRRSFLDNPLIIILSIAIVILSVGYFSTIFIPVVFMGFSYVAFMYYMMHQKYFWATLILSLQVYISMILGLWLFSIPLFFIFYYLVISRLLYNFTLPVKFIFLLHTAFFYFGVFLFTFYANGMDGHIFLILIANFFIDLFLVWILL